MTLQKDWWKTFFSGPWLDAQKHPWPEGQTKRDADFLEKALKLAPEAKILDVPCGEGRLSIELAKRNYKVTGVDISFPLLVEGRSRAEEGKLNINWEHMDMRDLPWKEEFDAAFCFWGSFGYFDDEGNKEFLNAAGRVLKPGGRLIIDTHSVDTLLPVFQKRYWRRMGDTLVLEDRKFEHVQSRVDVEWTLVKIKESKVVTFNSSIRIYTYHELCKLLEDAGFFNFEGYGSLDMTPFGFGSHRLLLMATRRI